MIIKIERENNLFPPKLKTVLPRVKQIYVEGNAQILNNFGLAVIGSRNSSKEGEKTANEFVSKLTSYDISIISGLAKGIDSIAHETCISNGGKTIAVLGSGFDHIYPRENKQLFKKIIKSGGAVISEYPPETQIDAKNFPMRNRIVSGLSDGVLMIEGKHRSGTTITARYALKQGKPVFCLPHSIHNQYGVGPNEIMKIGGRLVTKYKDIIEYYETNGYELKQVQKMKKKYYNEVLELLSEEILTKEEMALKIGKPISEINQQITMLELEGIISEEYRERI